MLPGEGATPLKEPVVGGGALSPLALANKAESVVSITSQCSFSSTIVHVGDKKPPESGMGVAEGAQNQGSIWSLSQSSLLPCLFLPSGPKWREGASILVFLTLCSPASLRHLVCPPLCFLCSYCQFTHKVWGAGFNLRCSPQRG